MALEHDLKESDVDVELSYVENVNTTPTPGYALQPKEERKIVRSGLEKRLVLKQDVLILPLLALVYFVAYLVRELKSKILLRKTGTIQYCSGHRPLTRHRIGTVSATDVF